MENENRYPSWLFTVMTNDFDDPESSDRDMYWYDLKTDDTEFKEAVAKLSSLKKKYSDYNKYLAAVELYDEYINAVIEFNGGLLVYESLLASGQEPDGYFPRPKLRKKKSNVALQNQDMVLSSHDQDELDVEEKYKLLLKINHLDDTSKMADVESSLTYPKGKLREALNEAAKQFEAKQRVKNLYSMKENTQNDILSAYYRDIEEGGYETEKPHISIDSAYDEYLGEKLRERELDGWEPSSHVREYVRNDIWFSTGNNDGVDIAKRIYDRTGIKIFDENNLDRETVKIYRREFGRDDDDDFVKETTKAWKRHKKREKKLKEKSAEDLLGVLTREKSSYNIYDLELTVEDFRKKYK